jgi:microcompartment protein CcmK/EutM
VFDGSHQVAFDALGGMLIDGTSANEWTIGDRPLAHNLARDILGLTDNEAVLLFAGSNSREEIQGEAELVAERAGEKL